MDADEIIPLTRESIARMLDYQREGAGNGADSGRRRAPRWPFPGAVQLWIPDGQDGDRMIIGTCSDISRYGLGVRADEPAPVGESLQIAIHLPEASYHGKATIRHCTSRKKGYFIGLEFDLSTA